MTESVLLHSSKVNAARRFVEDFLDDNTNFHLYMAFGDAGDWSPDPNVPDTPSDTLKEAADFWSGVMGVCKINDTDTTMVTKRVDWANGTAYTVYDSTVDTVIDWDNPTHYVINSENRVYKCTTAGGGNSTFEPIGAADADYTAADGYYWQYLYDASYSFSTLTNSWMPVPDAYAQTLGAHRILIRREIPDNTNSGGILPDTGTYNQTAIVVNPLQDDDVSIFTAEFGAASDLSTTLPVGALLMLDNRPPISRIASQSENAFMILSF